MSGVSAAAGMVEPSPRLPVFCRAPQLLIKLWQLRKETKWPKGYGDFPCPSLYHCRIIF